MKLSKSTKIIIIAAAVVLIIAGALFATRFLNIDNSFAVQADSDTAAYFNDECNYKAGTVAGGLSYGSGSLIAENKNGNKRLRQAVAKVTAYSLPTMNMQAVKLQTLPQIL